MGKPSISYQVRTIANEFDGRGTSKYDLKQQALREGLKPSDLTRDKIFSQSTRVDFIRVNTAFANYCKENFSISKLAQIKQEHFSHYWAENSPKWSLNTQSTYLDHFSRLSYYLELKGWGRGFLSDENKPSLKGYKSIENRSDRAIAWDKEGIEKLQTHLPDKYINAMQVFRETGIRAIEMQRIKLKDIDFKNKELHLVRKSRVEDDGKLKVSGSGKGGRPRTVSLSDEAIRALKAEIEKNGIRKRDDKVFANLKTDSLRKAIARFNERYGLPGRSIHSFRHFYAKERFSAKYTEIRKKGIPVKTSIKIARAYVSHILGHGKANQDQGRIGVTYAYLSSKEMYAIIAKIESDLGTSTPDELKYKGF